MRVLADERLVTLRSRITLLATSICCISITPHALAQSREADTLEVVIVTAQKRSERIENVPISITVMSGKELDSSTAAGVTEALNQVPGVATTLALQSGGTQVAVRGVTASGPLFNGSSPVAYYLDSVPFGLVKTAIAPDSNAYDMERIEVLRGPQSTLYGASAQNGVVRLLTQDPNLGEFELKARTSVSSTKDGSESYRGDMAINVPIVSEKFAARAVLGYQDLGGWIDRPNQADANSAELKNARLKLRAQPTDELSLGLSAWQVRDDYDAPSVSDDQRRNPTVTDESITTDYDVYGLEIGYEFAAFTFASNTSYVDYSNASGINLLPFIDVDATLTTALDSKVVAEEIYLNSTGTGSWRWSLGGMYRDAEDRLLQTFEFFPAPQDFTDRSKSSAIFGELTRIMADGRLELTVGLRHFEDEVTQIENVQNAGDPSIPLFRKTRTFNANSPRVVVTGHPGEDSTVYASYAEGFRSGFNQNPNVPADFPPLDADNLKNYEVGAKGNFDHGVFRYEAAVYYIDWQDVQQTATVDFNGLPVTALINGESASGLGIDLLMAVRPTDRLELGVNCSWNDLAMDADAFSGGFRLFKKGDRLSYSPELTAGGWADYTFPLGETGYQSHLSLAATYTSATESRAILDDVVIFPGESLLIGRASVSLEGGSHWGAMVFVDNITDEDSVVTADVTPVWSTRVRPRTVGLQVEYRF